MENSRKKQPAVSSKGSLPHDMEQLFLAAYDDYADAIFRHCALRIGDRDTAKDIMQDTFLKTWDYLRKGNSVENLRALLYAIANNLIIDAARRWKRRKEASLDQLQEAGYDPPDHTQSPVRDTEGAFVMETLQEVPEPYRTVLVMRYVDDLPPKEIAVLLGVSANVISVRIHRGLQHLRTSLTQTTPDNG